MNDILKRLEQFRDARDWGKYHTLKNLSMALSVEAAELMELFQWEIPGEPFTIMDDDNFGNVCYEIADCFIYLLNMCNVLNLNEDDIKTIINNKIAKNERKYPTNKI